MAEPFDTQATALAAALGLTLDAEQLADLSSVLEAQYPDVLTQLQQSLTFMGRIDGLLFVSAPPPDSLGQPGDVAINIVDKIFYGPKDAETGWGTGTPFLKGDPGDSAVISEVTATTGAAGSNASVVMGGTPLARTIAFTIPRGNTGLTPNITAAVTMIANGSPPVVTKSGTDAAPTLTFQIPAPLDGTNGRELEIQANATHIQTRYDGATSWTDLVSLASLKGAKGDKGDAFAVDATGAGLTARAAYDAEAEGFSFVDTDTGLIYFRQTATAGTWSAGVPFGAPQSDILDALADLDASAGLLLQTGAGTFEKRVIGVAADNQIPDRAAADSRYRRLSQGVPLADVTGAQAALDEKADAAATLALLGGKADQEDVEALDDRVGALEASGTGVASVAGLTGAVSAAALYAALGLSAAEAQQGIALADLRNTLQPLSSGVADSFADGTGISSLGAARRVLRGLTNAAVLTTPTMTGDTTSGWTAGSNDNSFRPAYRVFDKNTSTQYEPNNSGLPRTITLASPGPIRLTNYAPTGPGVTDRAPTAWTLEGSNDGGSTWATVDTRTGQTGWTSGLIRTYEIASPQFYSLHRWTFTAVQGSSPILHLAEITLAGDGPTGASTSIQSISFAAGAVPSAGILTVQARQLGAALVINTDLTGWVSRDGGATWTQAILTAGPTVGGFTTYTGAADLGGQPSGSSMRYKLDPTSALIEVAAAALQWA